MRKVSVRVGKYSTDNPIQTYLDLFEVPYTNKTRNYCEQQAKQMLQDLSISQYMDKVVGNLS